MLLLVALAVPFMATPIALPAASAALPVAGLIAQPTAISIAFLAACPALISAEFVAVSIAGAVVPAQLLVPLPRVSTSRPIIEAGPPPNAGTPLLNAVAPLQRASTARPAMPPILLPKIVTSLSDTSASLPGASVLLPRAGVAWLAIPPAPQPSVPTPPPSTDADVPWISHGQMLCAGAALAACEGVILVWAAVMLARRRQIAHTS